MPRMEFKSQATHLKRPIEKLAVHRGRREKCWCASRLSPTSQCLPHIGCAWNLLSWQTRGLPSPRLPHGYQISTRCLMLRGHHLLRLPPATPLPLTGHLLQTKCYCLARPLPLPCQSLLQNYRGTRPQPRQSRLTRQGSQQPRWHPMTTHITINHSHQMPWLRRSGQQSSQPRM